MRIISLKLSKLVIICAVILTGIILIIGGFFGNENNQTLIDSKKDDDKEMALLEDDKDVEQEFMEIFPREDYEDWDLEYEKEFFVEYRLQRDRIRSKEIDKLNQLMDNPEISQEAKEKAEDKLLEILKTIEKEMLIENLIKAHGFEDAILFYRENSATVVVKAENLSETEVYQIMEIVSDKTGIGINDIKVVENF